MLTIALFTKCNIKGLDNSMPPELEPNYQRIKQVYDWIIEAFPNADLNCGYRNKRFNTLVNGDKNSFHMKALALDLDSPQNSLNKQIFQFIIDNYEAKFGQKWDSLIWEKGDNNAPGWVHINIHEKDKTPRGRVQRYYYSNRLAKWNYAICDRNGKILITP